MPGEIELKCFVCGVHAEKGCAACKKIKYCGKDHQRDDWPRHKAECSGSKKPASSSSKPGAATGIYGNFTLGGVDARVFSTSQLPSREEIMDPAGWARGLSGSERAEWLVDCYRMRVDDDYAWGGCNLHGLYDPDADKYSIIADFLVFCKLAVRNKAIPPGWDWKLFLDKAAGLLPCAFEKEDAKDKYGSENFFMAAMGGRSLRATGTMVYGSGPMSGEEQSDAHTEVEDSVLRYDPAQLLKDRNNAGMFGEVGGQGAWQGLYKKMPAVHGRY